MSKTRDPLTEVATGVAKTSAGASTPAAVTIHNNGELVRRKPFGNRLHATIRWLHIYSSLFGLLTVLFFGATGLTLNHPDWFGTSHESIREASGKIDRTYLGSSQAEPRKLEIVELIRTRHQVRAAMRDFQIDEYQMTVSFAGPGYTADVRIDCETAEYHFTEVTMGLVAIINDLHKGRDTGQTWSVVIDVSAVLLVFISLSGLLLLCWLKRRWRAGLLTILAGSAALVAATWISVA